MVLERSAEETFDLAREAVTRLDWQVVNEIKPKGKKPGQIEAVARTLLMGYLDDVGRLEPKLAPAAAFSVLAHLEFLVERGLVQSEDFPVAIE